MILPPEGTTTLHHVQELGAELGRQSELRCGEGHVSTHDRLLRPWNLLTFSSEPNLDMLPNFPNIKRRTTLTTQLSLYNTQCL